jgi:hypothetical protein
MHRCPSRASAARAGWQPFRCSCRASRQADVDVLAGIDNVGHERTERVPLTQVGPDSSTGWCRTDFDESFVAGTEQAIEEMTGLAHRPRLIGVAHQVVAHRVQIQLKIASSYSVESVRWQRGQDSMATATGRYEGAGRVLVEMQAGYVLDVD